MEEERLASREKAAMERRELFLQRKSQQREVMQLQKKMELASSVSSAQTATSMGRLMVTLLGYMFHG